MPYPEPYNISGISGMMNYANTATGYLWSTLVIIALFLILFINLLIRNYRTSHAMWSASFVTALFTVFMRLAGKTTSTVMFFVLIITFFCTIWIWVDREG